MERGVFDRTEWVVFLGRGGVMLLKQQSLVLALPGGLFLGVFG